LGPRVTSTKLVNEADIGRASIAELLSESSESDGKLYHVFSLSSASAYSLSNESRGEESSDWPFNKSGKLNKPPKVAIIITKARRKV
jgi:hypothetical protein